MATIANQMFNAAQAKMKLIARIFAETGIKDLFCLLHAVIRKHGARAQTVRLRNQWVQVDPRDWQARNDMTINVGLGTGSKTEQLAHMMSILGLQKEAMAAGLGNLVDAGKLYNAAKEVDQAGGLKNVGSLFNDPAGAPEPQPQPDPKLIELQMKNEIEKTAGAGRHRHQPAEGCVPTPRSPSASSSTTPSWRCSASSSSGRSSFSRWSWRARSTRSTSLQSVRVTP